MTDEEFERIAEAMSGRTMYPGREPLRDERLLREAKAQRAEVARLTEALAKATERRGTTISCAFCFAAYPAGNDEDAIDATRRHVETCPKHPAADLRAKIVDLEGRLDVARSQRGIAIQDRDTAEAKADAALAVAREVIQEAEHYCPKRGAVMKCPTCAGYRAKLKAITGGGA